MLYKLGKSGEQFDSIEPLPFEGLPKEKHLEDLIAQNLFDVLFEGNDLMPIMQERAWQPEADIYALDRKGDLFVFELKRDDAGAGAVHQALRYCEKAAHLGFDELERQYRNYPKRIKDDLRAAHQEVFSLDQPLDRSAFNRDQHIIIVGSAGDNELVRNVDYWRSKGISIAFIPYRIYKIGDEHYFEFFSVPYDQHSNPGVRKGVIFDTNLSYIENSIWYMCENSRVAAFGDIKSIVHSFRKGDVAFLYHKGHGIVAAGEVRTEAQPDESADAEYCAVKWLTPVPKQGEPLKALPASRIKEVMGFNFWWAKTMKPPFLDKSESEKLLAAVNEELSK